MKYSQLRYVGVTIVFIAAWLLVRSVATEGYSSDIWRAASTGDIEGVKRYISEKKDLNVNDPMFGSTPLISASVFGQTQVVRLLIDNGARLNETNKKGSTALHSAAFLGRSEIVRLLLEGGEDKDAKNNNNQTPLEIVEQEWNKELENIYTFLEQTLRIPVDLEKIKAERPRIAEFLKNHKN